MERLIDANALKDKISNIKLRVKSPEMMAGLVEMKAAALREIENAQTVEAEPVRHGRWILDHHGVVVCNLCRYPQQIGAKDFCGKCGAKMDATDTNVGGKRGADNG